MISEKATNRTFVVLIYLQLVLLVVNLGMTWHQRHEHEIQRVAQQAEATRVDSMREQVREQIAVLEKMLAQNKELLEQKSK